MTKKSTREWLERTLASLYNDEADEIYQPDDVRALEGDYARWLAEEKQEEQENLMDTVGDYGFSERRHATHAPFKMVQ